MNKRVFVIVGLLVVVFIGFVMYSSGDSSSGGNFTPMDKRFTQGSLEAKHSLVLYTDPLCPHCSEFHHAADGLKEEYLDTDRLVFEERVVSMIRNVNSPMAAEAAYCAADQEKYHTYNDALQETVHEKYFSKGIATSRTAPPMEKLSSDFFANIAKGSGLDAAAFKKCIDTNEFKATVEENTQKATDNGVRGVPFFFIDERPMGSGFTGDYEQVKMTLRAGGVE